MNQARFGGWRGYATQTNGKVATRGWRVLFGVPIAVTFSLGVWQIHRLDRKRRLITDRKRRLAAQELSFGDLTTHPDPEYHPVVVEGRLIHSREMLVGPRSAPKEMPTAVLQWGGSSGLQVVTPMVLKNGEEVLINRGWIPQRLTPRDKRSQPAITPHPFMTSVTASTAMVDFSDGADESAVVTIHGVIRKGDDKNRFTPRNNPAQNEWFYIDPSQMHGTRYVIELLHPTAKTGWPHPRTRDELLTFRTPPSTHVTYAATWFSLSAALGLISRLRR